VVRYTEGVFVGYRHYDSRQVEPRFCFGHGLGYTRFEYANLAVSSAGDEVQVAVDVTNAGERAGQAVVQLYVHDVQSSVDRPEKELRAFEKLPLQPDQTSTLHFVLPRRAFAFWDSENHAWRVEPGDFLILVGASSRDMRASAPIRL
jgi:beta-glucosidase